MADEPPAKKQKKTIISPEQDKIIRDLFAQGMTGTGKKHEALLDKAVALTGLPRKVICSRIHNMRRPAQGAPKGERKFSHGRALSGYNVFCQVIGSKSNDKTERQRIWSAMWAKLSKDEKAVYEKKAKELNNTPLSALTGKEKKSATKTSLKAIRHHIGRLAQMEGRHGFFIFCDEGGFSTASCGSGTKILSDMEQELHYHFNQGIGTVAPLEIESDVSEEDRMLLRDSAQKKVREIYGQFLGKDGPRKFPYSKYSSGKTDFEVVGLPDGFTLITPRDMTIEQMKVLLDSTFTFAPRCSSGMTSTSHDGLSSSPGQVLPSANEPDFGPSNSTNWSTPTEADLPEEMDMDAAPELHVSPCPVETLPAIPALEPISDGIPSLSDTTPESIITVPVSSTMTLTIPISQPEDDVIETVPHMSNEEALHSVKCMAKAIEQAKSKPSTSGPGKPPKGYLRSLLGKQVLHLWKLDDPGKLTRWFKGIIVKKSKSQFAIRFNNEDGLHPINAQTVYNDIQEGTFFIVD